MNRAETLYLAPYIFSLLLSVGVFFYAWLHRQVRGARAYTWFVAVQALSIFGFVIELISPQLEIKILWDKFQWLTFSTFTVAYLVFAVQFTEQKFQHPKFTWGVLLAIPLLFCGLVLTDGFHHLIYADPHLSAARPFSELKYDFTTTVYIYSLYFYATTLYGIFILLRRAFQAYSLHRWQYIIIAAGFLIPVVLSVFALLGINLTPQRDSTPFTFAIENIIVAWGLFRYGLLDILPIARERILENMADPMVVLDPKNRIVDVNAAALTLLEKPLADVIGHTSNEAFARWPAIVSELEYLDFERKEIAIHEGDDTFFYDLNISPIYSNNRQLIGRILVARDITKQKTLETGYRLLSTELDQRVRERTEELHNSLERYRAVVENQTEFIVRWRLDGVRTFVNEAYCRYFGITQAEALFTSFIPLIVEEDRPAIDEKISRLISGAVDIETETHRVIKPDGSIGWQEWTDQAIRDETGKVIEFQSVGRDVTERKRAEEALRESEAIYRKAIEVAGGVPYRQTYHYYEGFHLHIIYDFLGEGIQQITGYRPDEITEDLWDSLVKETLLTGDLSKYSWSEAIQRVRSGSNPVWQCEHRIQTRDGETRWIYEVAVELRDKDGISYGSIGLFQDITARKLAEEALCKSEERFSKAFQASPIIITISQINSGMLLEVNEAFERVMGFTREEVIGKTTMELGLWANLTDRNRYVTTLLANGKIKNEEFQFRTKSGKIITCFFSAELIELGSERCVLAALEDITERKKAEARILRLNRLYATISQINQTIVHAHDKADLFREICRVATEPGQFRMAWIGLIDLQNGLVRPVIFTGEEHGYLTDLEIDIHHSILGRGPTGRTIREGHCIICQDIATDPSMIHWRDQALSRGYRSSAAVPFREQGHVVGALTVYSGEVQGFGAEDEELLEQIGLDISFALDSIHAETQRKQAETKLLNQLAFDELMTSLLARFATCSYSEVDASIESGMQAIAKFLDSDVADLITLSKDRTSWNSSHKWVAPHMRDKQNSKLNIPSGELNWTESKLLRGEAIIINTLDDYPPEAAPDRQFGEAEGIQSILTIPVRGLEQAVFGCIDIVSYSRQINWSESDVVHLKLIGDAIATLLERKNAEANLAEAYDTTLEGWARALELRDKETEGHSRRVTETTLAVARTLGVSEEELEHIRRGALLHDIGKMGVPDDILRKNGPLTKEERAIVEKHPTTAFNLLKSIPYLDKALDVPYCHHEKWDGSGYPRGLKGEEIPLGARIFAIVDVWDALSSERPYKKAWPQEQVLEYLKSQSGKHFDPRILNVFLEMIEKGAI
jgi:PAS domain S-box-containing protein/putative nucleotidyltransferase with HDIG domain